MGLGKKSPAILRKMVIRVRTFSICVLYPAAVHQLYLCHKSSDLSPSASSDLTSEGDLISQQMHLIMYANGPGSTMPVKQMAG